MVEDGLIEVGLAAGVVNTEVAGVVADKSGDDDHDKREQPAGFEGHDWQNEYEPSDHAVDDAEDGHGAGEVLGGG